jgi:hypothetical protein
MSTTLPLNRALVWPLMALSAMIGYTVPVLVATFVPEFGVRFARVRGRLRLIELRLRWPWWATKQHKR